MTHILQRVLLPAPLRAQMLAQAQAAFPRECCGLLEGICGAAGFDIVALHPARNLSADAATFSIDPEDQLTAQKTARANGRQIIGCYHSHPDNVAQPSKADLAGAQEEGFLWLIAGKDALNAFVYRCGRFDRCVTGADWVTSSG